MINRFLTWLTRNENALMVLFCLGLTIGLFLLMLLVGFFLVSKVGASEGAKVEVMEVWPQSHLVIAEEYAGGGYIRDEWEYTPDVEVTAAEIYHYRSMYTNHQFTSIKQSQIEHLVAIKEAWRSGGWRWSKARKRAFASDRLNIVLALPGVNRAKSDSDPKKWLPPKNQCFYVVQWVAVKLKWGLSVDPMEWISLQKVLAHCGLQGGKNQ